ncbi:site-specific integrase [Tsukamurella soli]|uniref:hypothetical protein n=1 Tax=Tsukamurella soli TaxID=644556 RepID=UPI00360D1BD9
MLAVYGFRRGEILALGWDAVDFDANTIGICASRLAVSGGSETGATKTKTSTRTLPTPADLARASKAERKRHREMQLQLGTLWPNSGLVVVDALGNPPHPDTLTHAWRDALVDADLPTSDCTTHGIPARR